MELIKEPGIYNISMEDYQGDPSIEPSLSRSVIKDLIYRSPAHAWFNHPRLNPDFQKDEGEKKFDVGQVAHSLFLEGLDSAVLVDGDDWRKKEAREARDKARAEGKIPLLVDQYEKVKKMVKTARQAIFDCDELKIGSLNQQGDSDLSYLWKEDGTWVRIRPDWISEDRKIILDYKTTLASGNPEDVSRLILNMGYDIQAALYARGVKAIDGIDPKFIFIFQEVEEPYLCSFVGLPPDFMELGKSKCDYGIFLWRECMSTNQWPGYPQRVCWVDRPEWASLAWDRRAQGITGMEANL